MNRVVNSANKRFTVWRQCKVVRHAIIILYSPWHQLEHPEPDSLLIDHITDSKSPRFLLFYYILYQGLKAPHFLTTPLYTIYILYDGFESFSFLITRPYPGFDSFKISYCGFCSIEAPQQMSNPYIIQALQASESINNAISPLWQLHFSFSSFSLPRPLFSSTPPFTSLYFYSSPTMSSEVSLLSGTEKIENKRLSLNIRSWTKAKYQPQDHERVFTMASVITNRMGYWSISLVLQGGGLAPRLDMTLDQDIRAKNQGMLDWAPNVAHDQTWLCLRNWDYSMPPDAKAKDVYKLVQERGLDSYDFT